MTTDSTIIPCNVPERSMTLTNLNLGPKNLSASSKLNLKSMGKAITSHFSKIMLANPMDDASSNSDSDSDSPANDISFQFRGLKVGTSTNLNSDSDSEESDDSCTNVIKRDDMSNTNSTADHSPCKKLSRRKAVTLFIPALSRPTPTKE